MSNDNLTHPAPAAREAVPEEFQAGVGRWMDQCFIPSLYSNMTERGDRLLEEVLELLQSHGYDRARAGTLVEYVYGRPAGEPAQEVGGVMVTLAGYCWIAGLNMHAEGARELARITQPEVMAKIRAKQEAKNALHFDTPLPGAAAPPPQAKPQEGPIRDPKHPCYEDARIGVSVPRTPPAAPAESGREVDEFTPGPWQECGHERGGCSCGLVWAVGADMPVADTSLSHDEELRGNRPDAAARKANARLIADAPAIRDALVGVVNWYADEEGNRDETPPAICAALAALKGEGR